MEIFTADNLIWTLFAAVLAAIVYSFFMQRTLSGLAKRIMKAGASSPETALTAEKLGYKSGIVKLAVKHFASGGSSIARAVKAVFPEKSEKSDDELMFEKKPQPKYYIPDENITPSFKKHAEDTLSVPKLVLIIVILTAIALVAKPVVRVATQFVSNAVTSDDDSVVGVDTGDDSLLSEQEQLNRREEAEKKKQEQLEALEKQAEEERKQAELAQNAVQGDGGTK